MTQQTTKSVILQAKELANEIYSKSDSIRRADDEINEELFNLIGESGGKFESFIYKNMLVKLMSIICEPAVSEKLDRWDRENVGKVLFNMYEFFERLESMEVDKYVDWIYLSRFSGSMTEKELAELQHIYLVRPDRKN